MAGGACLGSDGFAPRVMWVEPRTWQQRVQHCNVCNTATGLQGVQTKETCGPDRQLALPTVEGGIYEGCVDQHAAEISMAELHAAIFDRAAVRSG